MTYGSGKFSGTEFTDTVTIAPGLVIPGQSIGVASTASCIFKVFAIYVLIWNSSPQGLAVWMEFSGKTLRHFPLDVLVSCLQPSVGPVDLTFGKSKEPLCGIAYSPPDRHPVPRNNFDSPNSDRQFICERCHHCQRNRCLLRAYYTAISCEWGNYMGYVLSFMFAKVVVKVLRRWN